MTGDTQEIIKEIRPVRNLRTLYTIYLLIIVWGGILPWLIPLAFYSPPLITLSISFPLLIIVVYTLWWIGAFHRTIRYGFTNFEIVWQHGIWFPKIGIVPYDRIAAIEITRGPLSRFLGFFCLQIQTLGGDNSGNDSGILKIDGICEPEPLRDFIMNKREEAARAHS
jgi:membrane protein YdbS with pleckstrin-like domain